MNIIATITRAFVSGGLHGFLHNGVALLFPKCKVLCTHFLGEREKSAKVHWVCIQPCGRINKDVLLVLRDLPQESDGGSPSLVDGQRNG